jgi:hypothetical protein
LAVTELVDALANVPVSTATGNVETIVAELTAEFNAHLANGILTGVHAETDTANRIANSFSYCTSSAELPKFINQALKSFAAHYVNDVGAGGSGDYGPDTALYHKPAADLLSDRTNAPVYVSVGSFGEAYGALGDLHRSLLAHADSASLHSVVIEASLTDLPPILQVHSAYCAVLASTNPTVPPAQSTGMQTLISSAGFKEG